MTKFELNKQLVRLILVLGINVHTNDATPVSTGGFRTISYNAYLSTRYARTVLGVFLFVYALAFLSDGYARLIDSTDDSNDQLFGIDDPKQSVAIGSILFVVSVYLLQTIPLFRNLGVTD